MKFGIHKIGCSMPEWDTSFIPKSIFDCEVCSHGPRNRFSKLLNSLCMQIRFQCLFCKKEIEIIVSVTRNGTGNKFLCFWFLFMSKIGKRRDHCSSSLLKIQKSKKKSFILIWLLSHWLVPWEKLKTSNFRICVVIQRLFFCNKKLNLNIFVTLFEHSTSMHHQEIASSNMTKDRRQQSRVKRHSIYIRTVLQALY